MRSFKTLEQDANKNLLRDLAVFFWAACVIGTTFLNVAFSIAPQAMTHFLKVLMA